MRPAWTTKQETKKPKNHLGLCIIFPPYIYADLACFATSLGETLPARISFVVARIVDQFWKVVYGIPRRSQKVTRSRPLSVARYKLKLKISPTFALLSE